ncbi:MAG: EamA/RhaT family transporter [Betaproteobacteria bacterium]|nr:MAG: EamA/RhaT family transporter [Betaproteobacteria bacterium]
MAIVGAYVGFSKVLVAVFPVFLLAWLRFGIAAVAMTHWLRSDGPPLDLRTKKLLFLESFVGNFLFSICMLFGMRYAGAVTAGVVMAAIPAVVALLSRAFLKEPLSARTLCAIALAVAGVATLALTQSTGTNAGGAVSLIGTLLLLGAVFCEASYVVIGKTLTGNVSPRRISALINLWGLVLVTPFGIWQALSFDFSSVSTPIWGGLVLYALAASMWTVWLWMTGLKHVPAARAGIFTVFLPITAALVGVLFLNEPFTKTHLLAFAFAIAAVLLATWPSKLTSSEATASPQ